MITTIVLAVGAACSLFVAFYRPARTLPWWAYVLLSADWVAASIVNYIRAGQPVSLSDPYSLILLQAWSGLAGFSAGILLVLIVAGACPPTFKFRNPHDGESPASR